MKIKIIQMADSPHASKYKGCLNINKKYCQKHGYEFHAQQPAWPTPGVGYGSSGEAYYTPYQKPYVLLENLHTADYVVWVDIDAVFVNHEKKIEDVINLEPERDIIYFDDPAPKTPLNSGVLIVKSNTTGSFILWKWWEACRAMCTKSRGLLNWDQGILIELLTNFIPGHKFEPLPKSLMNQHPLDFKSGELLVHWMGYWPESISQHMQFLSHHIDKTDFVGKFIETLSTLIVKAEHGAPCKTVSVDDVIEKMKQSN